MHDSMNSAGSMTGGAGQSERAGAPLNMCRELEHRTHDALRSLRSLRLLRPYHSTQLHAVLMY